MKSDIAIRVLADHIRAVAFAIADGQLPSNTGAGYVIRRILRRAVRYAFTFLHFKEPFLHRLVPVLSQQFKDIFPELDQQRDYVVRVILEEEQSFLRTLEKASSALKHLNHRSAAVCPAAWPLNCTIPMDFNRSHCPYSQGKKVLP